MPKPHAKSKSKVYNRSRFSNSLPSKSSKTLMSQKRARVESNDSDWDENLWEAQMDRDRESEDPVGNSYGRLRQISLGKPMRVASYKSSKIRNTPTVVSSQLPSSGFPRSQHSITSLSQHSESSQHVSPPQSDAIMEQERCRENVPNSQSSHSDIHKRARITSTLNISPGFEAGLVSDNDGEEDLGYLWYGTRRRQKAPFPSSASHQAVTASTLLMLQASILTGDSGPPSTPWPEVTKAWFHNQMNTVWRGVRKQYVRNFGTSDGIVSAHPTKYEAREIYDSFSSFQSHAMAEIRDLVQTIYSLGNNRTLETTALYVRLLLTDDKFCCKDLESGRGRFMADIIIKGIDMVFFNSAKGLGLHHISAPYFAHFSPNLIVFIIVAIRHAIEEWRSGVKRVDRFDYASSHKTWARTWSTWEDQSDRKQEAVLLNIQRRVMRGKEGDISERTAPLQNDYKNSLDDIDDNPDTLPIPISSSSMVHSSVPLSPLSEENLAYELSLGIASSSPVRARVARVKKGVQRNDQLSQALIVQSEHAENEDWRREKPVESEEPRAGEDIDRPGKQSGKEDEEDEDPPVFNSTVENEKQTDAQTSLAVGSDGMEEQSDDGSKTDTRQELGEDEFVLIFDGHENIWTFDTPFEDFQNICPSNPDAIMHYTIKGSRYQDVALLPLPREWTKFKRRVKECGGSRQVVMETSDDTAWDSPDTERRKAAEMASKTKGVSTEAAKIKTLQKTTIKRKAAPKKVVKRK